MKVRLAYIEEPPFYYTAGPGRVLGSDIELAGAVLRAAGVASVEHHATTFAELLPGLEQDRWDMNVPIFVTEERARRVAFSLPVWSLGDGLLLPAGNPKALTSYRAVAERADARLGIVAGTVQIDSARAAGVRDTQIELFASLEEAVQALLAGRVDAYPSTAVGHRVLAESHPQLQVVAIADGAGQASALGAFSFSKNNPGLLRAVDEQLRQYLGSADHRARMARYGLTNAELDRVAGVASQAQ